MKKGQKLLPGLGVLLTRSESRSKSLQRKINELGAKVLTLPVIEIESYHDSEQEKKMLTALSSMDLVIFVSANAVTFANERVVASLLKWPSGPVVAAIGPATHQALKKAGITASIVPTGEYNTESLLTQPRLQNLSGQSVMIIRGCGGRETLADILKTRGAVVEYFEVYKRILPTTVDQTIFAGWHEQVDIVIVTSVNAMENLLLIAGRQFADLVVNTPLLVISQRMHDAALRLKFVADIIRAEKASDDAILTALLEWQQKIRIKTNI